MSGWEWFRGEFRTFDEARRQSAGYDDPAILERVAAATRRVAAGEALFERDGVAFDRPFVNAPLLRGLLAAAAEREGRLRVLDFGGALGSAYWQHRDALKSLQEVAWLVVEQPHFVAAGRREIAEERLVFCDDIASALGRGRPDFVLASSVLQYLPDPWSTLESLVALRAPWLFLDRIPLLASGQDRLTIEHVPPELGATSYPAWFLGESRLLDVARRSYDVVERFWTVLEDGIPESWQVFGQEVPNQGLLLRLR